MSRTLLRRKRIWLILALLAGGTLALLYRRELVDFFRHFSWPEIRAAVRASGPWAPLICILLYAVFCALFLPTTLVGILVALLYGPWLGLPVCLAGLALGMGIPFLTARYLFHDWIDRRIGHSPLYRRIKDHLHHEGWKFVLFSRLLPINPFALLNYAYGLTRIPFRHYLLASVAGVIPNTLALLWTVHAAGELATGRLDWKIILLLSCGAFLFAALAWLPRLLRRNLPDAVPEPEK